MVCGGRWVDDGIHERACVSDLAVHISDGGRALGCVNGGLSKGLSWEMLVVICVESEQDEIRKNKKEASCLL